MKLGIEQLYEFADEEMQRHEAKKDEEDSRKDYHEGWMDAMRWLLDVLEPEIYRVTSERTDDEAW